MAIGALPNIEPGLCRQRHRVTATAQAPTVIGSIAAKNRHAQSSCCPKRFQRIPSRLREQSPTASSRTCELLRRQPVERFQGEPHQCHLVDVHPTLAVHQSYGRGIFIRIERGVRLPQSQSGAWSSSPDPGCRCSMQGRYTGSARPYRHALQKHIRIRYLNPSTTVVCLGIHFSFCLARIARCQPEFRTPNCRDPTERRDPNLTTLSAIALRNNL